MSTQDRHHLNDDEIVNLTWDNTYDVLAIVALVEDKDSSPDVLRRLQVNASGEVKVV